MLPSTSFPHDTQHRFGTRSMSVTSSGPFYFHNDRTPPRAPFDRDDRGLNRESPEKTPHSAPPVASRLGAAGCPLPFWKRAIDLAVCVAALPFFALCTLAMTILTRCVSPGPVFFQQERIGYMGRRFKIYKFRTMRVGADCAVHQNYTATLIGSNAPMVKLDTCGDARLIPFAWLLRASGLDELPQLINVFLGEMSLVGPRPCIPSEFAHYVSWQRQRCDALPGLTGLWQVSGKNQTTFEEMIRLDIQYARKFSLLMDLKIIILTAPCLLTQLRETRRTRKSPPYRRHLAELKLPGKATSNRSSQTSAAQGNTQPMPTETAVGKPGVTAGCDEPLLDWLCELRRRSTEPKQSPRQQD